MVARTNLLHAVRLKMPSWRTIYRWLYEKYLVNGNLKVLRRKGKSHGVKETRCKYNKGRYDQHKQSVFAVFFFISSPSTANGA